MRTVGLVFEKQEKPKTSTKASKGSNKSKETSK